jgi:hypothetical protein
MDMPRNEEELLGRDADSGEPSSGQALPREIHPNIPPPFVTAPWQPPSRLAKAIQGGVTITLRITPYLITAWIFAPADIKYEIRKQSRWLPWAVKYAAWWLKQEGW